MNGTRVTRYILRTWYKALRDPEGYWFKRNLKWLYGGLKNLSEEDQPSIGLSLLIRQWQTIHGCGSGRTEANEREG